MENETIASKAPILEKISMLKDTVVSGINSSSEVSQKIGNRFISGWILKPRLIPHN